MIPADVNIDDLAQQLAEDRVALESNHAQLHDGLETVINELSESSFGSVGIAVLDKTPDQTADLRDIAQVLLNESALDSVIVRSPSSGAIVSNIHSRADIESAQWDFLANPDYPEATRILGEHIMNNPSNELALTIAFVAMAVFAILVSAIASWIASSRRRKTN